MNARHVFLSCFIVVCLMVTWQELKECHSLPFPTRFIAAGIVFGMLDVTSSFLGNISLLVGVGYMIAIIICTVHPSNTCSNRITAADCNAYISLATSQPSSYDVIEGAPQQTGQTS